MGNMLIAMQQQDIDGESVTTVNARDLHVFLEVGKDFSNWIKDRITKYGFAEDVDYIVTFDSPGLANQLTLKDVCSPNLASKGRGGHNAKEYHLTLNMAKELAMLENNERGREVRRYFIRCEKDLHTLQSAGTLRLENAGGGGDPDLLAARYVMTIKAFRKSNPHSMDSAILAEQALADQGYNLAVIPDLLFRHGDRTPGPWQMLVSTLALTPVRRTPRGSDDDADDRVTTVLDVLEFPSRWGRTELLQPLGLCAANLKKWPHLVIPDASQRFAKRVMAGTAWDRDGSWLDTLGDVPGVLLHRNAPCLYNAGAYQLGTWVPLAALRQAVAWRKLDPLFQRDFPHVMLPKLPGSHNT